MTHQPLRAAIIDRAAKLGKTAADVAELVSDSISRSQVYRYWSGECDLTSEKVDALLVALGMRVTVRRG